MSTDEPPIRKCVLLVEDDDIVRMLTVEILEEFGYRVQAMSDAPSALQLLQQGEPVDLLMTDVSLPGLSGRELVQATRALRPTLPVLFASGYGEQAIVDEARQRHPDARTESIVKPYDLNQLADCLSLLANA